MDTFVDYGHMFAVTTRRGFAKDNVSIVPNTPMTDIENFIPTHCAFTTDNKATPTIIRGDINIDISSSKIL